MKREEEGVQKRGGGASTFHQTDSNAYNGSPSSIFQTASIHYICIQTGQHPHSHTLQFTLQLSPCRLDKTERSHLGEGQPHKLHSNTHIHTSTTPYRLDKTERSHLGVGQLRHFLEQLLQKRYLDNVPMIVPLLEKESRSVQVWE